MAVEIIEYADIYVFQFGLVFAWEDLMKLHNYFRAGLYPPPDHWRHRLVDLRQTRETELNYQKMANYVHLLTPTPAPADLKIALVVATPLLLGYARMFQTMVDPTVQQVEVFEELFPALEWLAVGETTRQALVN